ncbi:unnamed protein product [Urochloa decumbens]|uniref:RRM domain-containing protein n=1 Tax=Urochloa decumbens TaxID=240449 RepID=A0ABC8VGV6_9POAL
MPRDRDEPPAVRVYTVCDESKYLVVRNVPSLGCGDDLANLFGTYGAVEECKPMDAEDCEPYTDVFFIKFSQVSNARFAKRKLDESEKLEVRRKEVLGRIKSSASRPEGTSQYSLAQGPSSGSHHHQMNSNKREYVKTIHASHIEDPRFSHVPSNKDYFPSESMNATVKLVREKLDKIQSGGDNSDAAAASKKPRVDNRRRI